MGIRALKLTTSVGIHHCLGLFLLALIALSMETSAAEKTRPKEVLDLHYGEVLFHFYQDDYFSSITHLQAARHREQLTHHQDDADLLYGGLVLSYGLDNEAVEIFDRLLDQNTETAVQDRAWFYMARLRYQRNYMAEAEQALARISPENLNAEQQLLLTQVYMAQGKYDQAIKLFSTTNESADWLSYGKYNLGVALIKTGQVEQGISLISELGRIESDRDEDLALRDKANLMLGYTYIQQDDLIQAKTYLENVQLNGIFSNKALLGLGWAESANGNYQRALVSWDELRTRDVMDTSVQEALLAIPYAYEQLQANGQAAEHYSTAIELFQQETNRIDGLKTSILQDGMVDELMRNDLQGGMGWLWQLRQLPKGLQNQMLFQLLAGHEFQEVLKNYRDLRFLVRDLSYWADSMDAFDDILALRREAYETRLPRIQAISQRLELDQSKYARDAELNRLLEIQKEHDSLVFANATEKEQWSRFLQVDKILVLHPDREEWVKINEKQRLLIGIFNWQLDKKFQPGLQILRNHIEELNSQIIEHEKRLPRIQVVRQRLDFDQNKYTRDAELNRLLEIEEEHDALVFANATEKEQWSRFLQVNKILVQHPDKEEWVKFNEKQRLLTGVFNWQLDQKFQLRLQVMRNQIKELGRQIIENEKRLPQTQVSYQQLDIYRIKRIRDVFVQRLLKIEKENDALGLVSAMEKEQWSRFLYVNKILVRHPDQEEWVKHNEKQRLLEGVFIWQIDQEYIPRLQVVRKQINELNSQIKEVEQRQASLLVIQQQAPKRFEGYGDHIAKLRQRIDLTQSRVSTAIAAQELHLQQLVMSELDERSTHLRTFTSQARYGLARIFDSSLRQDGLVMSDQQ